MKSVKNALRNHLAERPETAAVIITSKWALATKIGARTIVIDEGSIVYDGDVNEAWKILMGISKSRGEIAYDESKKTKTEIKRVFK